MRLKLVPRPNQPDFLDLPWSLPLEEWRSERLAVVERGIGRHVVRFVEYEGVFYALKELPHRLAHREYHLLGELARDGVPAVEVVGALCRPGPLSDVLITRHLEFSLPFRLVLARRPVADVRGRLLDALAELLVRLHLGGFFWGDCSLSNTLFRRDAGALAAYVVDVETGELHETLTEGQREHDLSIACENLAGELYDLQAELDDAALGDPIELADEAEARYRRLWDELVTEEEFGRHERSRLAQRIRRLHDRGFDVQEIELETTEAGYRLAVRPQLVDAGHHRRRLLHLTGLDAQENQARRLLADIEAHRAALERSGVRPASDAALAGRWLAEVFEPALAAVPPDLRGKRQAAQLYHELLDHRWYRSEEEGRELPLDEAVASYVDSVLRGVPDERTVLGGAGTEPA